jgi:DNA (cytosine-5)-methyltransferase 1
MVKIKEFMALYGIVDILMRMLRIPELKKIMGFPEDYVLVGTQADQKKFIGNAVEVTVSKALCEALSGALVGEELSCAI